MPSKSIINIINTETKSNLPLIYPCIAHITNKNRNTSKTVKTVLANLVKFIFSTFLCISKIMHPKEHPAKPRITPVCKILPSIKALPTAIFP